MRIPEGYEDNDVPVRSPFFMGATNNISTQDEEDFSTLKELQTKINEDVKALHSVDAFDLTEKEGLSIKEQMQAYRMAESIVAPLQSLINDTVNTIKQNQKERFQ